MKQTIDYIIADPEGNITILVLSPVERKDYQRIAHELLEKHPEAEQVGYVLAETAQKEGKAGLPAMNMCGMEFCGNASRSFAFYASTLQEPRPSSLKVQVSGCDHPLEAWIEPEDDDGEKLSACVRLEMPLPEEIEDIRIKVPSDLADMFGLPKEEDGACLGGKIVHLDGISHLAITSVPYDRIRMSGHDELGRLFAHIKGSVYRTSTRDLPAFGVMFLDAETKDMTPIVYVRDVDTTYFEGSCASGTAAAACACALEEAGENGDYSYSFRQPKGTLSTDIRKEACRISQLLLYGNVKLSARMQMETEVLS